MTEAVMITASVMKELINQVLINVELLDNIRQYLIMTVNEDISDIPLKVIFFFDFFFN